MVEAVRVYEPSSLRQVVFAVFGEEAKRAFDAAVATAPAGLDGK